MKKVRNTSSLEGRQLPGWEYTQLEKWVINIAIVFYFPMVYLIGKSIVTLLEQ